MENKCDMRLQKSIDANEETEDSRKGPWTYDEDMQLVRYVSFYGDGRWDALAKASGLRRSGKSCRLRWVNYLRPDLKHTKITFEEETLIIELHNKWGNRWSKIAQSLPGRTDNEIKNYFRTHIRKKINNISCSQNNEIVHVESPQGSKCQCLNINAPYSNSESPESSLLPTEEMVTKPSPSKNEDGVCWDAYKSSMPLLTSYLSLGSMCSLDMTDEDTSLSDTFVDHSDVLWDINDITPKCDDHIF